MQSGVQQREPSVLDLMVDAVPVLARTGPAIHHHYLPRHSVGVVAWQGQ